MSHDACGHLPQPTETDFDNLCPIVHWVFPSKLFLLYSQTLVVPCSAPPLGKAVGEVNHGRLDYAYLKPLLSGIGLQRSTEKMHAPLRGEKTQSKMWGATVGVS